MSDEIIMKHIKCNLILFQPDHIYPFLNSHNSEWSSTHIDMDKDSFAGLNNLHTLDLSYNYIWSLPLDSLCHLPKLKILNMTKNHLLDMTDLGLGSDKKIGK